MSEAEKEYMVGQLRTVIEVLNDILSKVKNDTFGSDDVNDNLIAVASYIEDSVRTSEHKFATGRV